MDVLFIYIQPTYREMWNKWKIMPIRSLYPPYTLYSSSWVPIRFRRWQSWLDSIQLRRAFLIGMSSDSLFYRVPFFMCFILTVWWREEYSYQFRLGVHDILLCWMQSRIFSSFFHFSKHVFVLKLFFNTPCSIILIVTFRGVYSFTLYNNRKHFRFLIFVSRDTFYTLYPASLDVNMSSVSSRIDLRLLWGFSHLSQLF